MQNVIIYTQNNSQNITVANIMVKVGSITKYDT